MTNNGFFVILVGNTNWKYLTHTKLCTQLEISVQKLKAKQMYNWKPFVKHIENKNNFVSTKTIVKLDKIKVKLHYNQKKKLKTCEI